MELDEEYDEEKHMESPPGSPRDNRQNIVTRNKMKNLALAIRIYEDILKGDNISRQIDANFLIYLPYEEIIDELKSRFRPLIQELNLIGPNQTMANLRWVQYETLRDTLRLQYLENIKDPRFRVEYPKPDNPRLTETAVVGPQETAILSDIFDNMITYFETTFGQPGGGLGLAQYTLTDRLPHYMIKEFPERIYDALINVLKAKYGDISGQILVDIAEKADTTAVENSTRPDVFGATYEYEEAVEVGIDRMVRMHYINIRAGKPSDAGYGEVLGLPRGQ